MVLRRILGILYALWLALCFEGHVRLARALPNEGVAFESNGSARILRDAEFAEENLDFTSALNGYDLVISSAPSSTSAVYAEARSAALHQRSEGNFMPLVKLERVRRMKTPPFEVITELLRDAEAFPPGLVRVEAWGLAADAFAYRLGRAADAEVLLQRIAADPHADEVIQRKATRDAVTLALARGDLARATEALSPARTRGTVDALSARDVARLTRRGTFRRVAWAAVGFFGALATTALVRARTRTKGGPNKVREAVRASMPLILSYTLFLTVIGAVLATGYNATTVRPFLGFGSVLFVIATVARVWSAVGSDTRGTRAWRAGVAGTATIAAAFLVLERVDAAFLERFGL